MIKNTECLLRYTLTDIMASTLVSIALRGCVLKCIVLGINQQSSMLILPWPCAECVENSVCGAKDNTAAFVLKENNTADDAALCRRCCPRSHVSFCQVTRPDKVAYCKVQMIRCTDLSLNCKCIIHSASTDLLHIYAACNSYAVGSWQWCSKVYRLLQPGAAQVVFSLSSLCHRTVQKA